MTSFKKICLISTGLGIGGAEKQLCDLADNFVRNGKAVIIISLCGAVITKPSDDNITIYSLNMRRNIVSFVSCLFKAKYIIKRFSPDVIHSHMFHANIFSRILRLFCDFKILVSSAHSTNEGGRLRTLAYQLTDRLADISTNVSCEAVDAFIRKKAVPKDKIITMYNGIDTDKFIYSDVARSNLRNRLLISDDELLVLSVGRLTEAKNYPSLLSAFCECSKLVNAHLVIIGGGHLENELKNMAVMLGIKSKVHFLGIRDDVSDWMSSCDVFVLSSSWEGFGLVVAEAMSCERIVVGTDSGGVREVIHDDNFIVPINEPKILADKIKYTLSLSSELRKKLGLKNRSRIVNNFSIKNVSQSWLDLYQKLLDSKNS